jgi:acyl-CoA dehydrogenase
VSRTDLLVDTVNRLFERNSPLLGRDAEGEADLGRRIWAEVERLELATIGVAEEQGGAGGSLVESGAVLQAAARHAPPIPLAECHVAAWLLAAAGLAIPGGPLTVGPARFGGLPRFEAGGNAFAGGESVRVPFAPGSGHLALLATKEGKTVVALVDLEGRRVDRLPDLAGQPRRTVWLEDVEPLALAPSPVGVEELMARGALARSHQVAGALDRVLQLSVAYAAEREQFGRPINRFQAVQHHLADAAAEAAAAAMAAEAASELAETGRLLEAAAIAKVRTGLASRAAAIAHQVHGAIGVTEEHSLHLLTRRIWAWRDDFGTELEWSRRLGARMAAAGGGALWPEVSLIT